MTMTSLPPLPEDERDCGDDFSPPGAISSNVIMAVVVMMAMIVMICVVMMMEMMVTVMKTTVSTSRGRPLSRGFLLLAFILPLLGYIIS